MPEKIEISYRTIFFILALILAGFILYWTRGVVFVLFIAFIITAALNPLVEKLEKFKIPRPLGIIFLFLLIFGFIVFAVLGVVPPLVNQSYTLIKQIPHFLDQFKISGIDSQTITSQLGSFSSLPNNLIKFSLGIFSNIIALIGLLVITFYFLMERKNLEKYLTTFLGENKGNDYFSIIHKIEDKLGSWVRGELILMFFVGSISYLGFRLLGLEFALPLAIIAFFLELIPNIGPIVAAVPAVVLGLTVSPVLALMTTGWCFLVQQIENSILVPRIMKSSVGISPLISIFSLIIGFEIAGVAGAILAVPLFLVLEIILKNFLKK